MTKKLILLTFLLCIFSFSAYAQTVLQGQVKDADGEVIGAGVFLFKNDVQVKAAQTDFDGNYIFTNIDAGTYVLEVKYLGAKTQRIEGVVVTDNSTTKVNVDMVAEGSLLDEVVVTAYKVPLISFDQTSSVKTVTAEAIANSPIKSVQGLASTSAGLSSDSDGNISIRGMRSNATNYYVDGIRVTSAGLLPAAEIEQLQVITGGLAAKYGDVTGGVISLISKGPSERFSGGFEAETSQFLDAYGFNFLNGNISGPLYKKNGKSIVGFRFNAQYVSQLDDRPSAVGVYRMPAEIIADLEETPNFLIDGVSFPRAELLNETHLSSPLKTRPNEDRFDLDLNGKIDVRLSENIDISLSGIYGTDRNRFTPGGGWGLLNWTHNPYTYGNNYRVNGRWRHKLGKQGLPEEEVDNSATLLRNASYIIQVGVENVNSLTEDFTHGDNLFNYGLYGTQEVTSEPVAGFVNPEEWNGSGALETPFGLLDHNSFSQVSGEFNPFLDENGTESPNPVLSKYQTINGQLIGTAVDVWSFRFFDNVGRVYNNFSKSDNTRYTVNFDAQLDVLPGGSINNRHNLQFGGTYELRTNRFWTMNPRELWTMARDAANAHFVAGVDTTMLTGNIFAGQQPFNNFEFSEYERLIELDEDKLFYEAIRDQLGLSLNDFVNVDGADVVNSGLTLDQFSASEIINWRDLGVNYYGYNYKGEVSNGGSFNDFFSAVDENNRRTFEVAPLNPVYIAGYIQDKFSYEDIILRVGVRADYFDANTRVLEDPYSLYAIETAQEFSARRDVNIPASVDPEARVYLTGSDKETDGIKAFRVGDDWFNPDGTATDAQLIFGSEPVNPSFRHSEEENNIQDRNFNPDNSFVDYVPSLKVTPRISLSFPISEDAGFFAHYDQLVQRPSSNTQFTALNYYFFEDISRLNPGGAPANNPNLRPETTIDYEVGFQQRLTNSSSIKLNAYYRENRDLIQTRFLLNVPVVTDYLTFDNIDFGTVKGFTATYDLRRTGNIELNASYTLQYAEGTGSNSNSGLSSRNGEVRVLIPLSFDERHRIVSNIDYRYASGDKYNGPRISGVDIFANTGLNFQVSAISGRPYTRQSTINNPFASSGFTGDINGARLPWQYNVDMRLDKNFSYKFNKDGKGGLNFNVYLRVSNLFDTQNVIGVYRVTGSPDNDGFLATQFGADALNSIETSGKDVQSYLAAYEWGLLQPGFYTLPRRIRVGGIVNF